MRRVAVLVGSFDAVLLLAAWPVRQAMDALRDARPPRGRSVSSCGPNQVTPRAGGRRQACKALVWAEFRPVNRYDGQRVSLSIVRK